MHGGNAGLIEDFETDVEDGHSAPDADTDESQHAEVEVEEMRRLDDFWGLELARCVTPSLLMLQIFVNESSPGVDDIMRRMRYEVLQQQ